MREGPLRRLLKQRPTVFLKEPLVTKLKETELAGAGIYVPKPPQEVKPETGRTFKEQSDESYCLECVEGHTMVALTEMRHAIDRFRSGKAMTSGVMDKVRAAIAELQGINEDVKSTENASPEVKRGLDEILDEVRWIRKEYGMAGKGLTRGYGQIADLENLRNRILVLQNKAYRLAESCPTCKVRR